MKKITVLLLLVMLMPTIVLAAPKYESKTLEEALKDEKIEYDLGDYEEKDDQVTIYLFRGKGCSHCYEFLEYVSSKLIKEYGDKIKVVTYEVWNNKNNSKLMEKISDYFKDDASGVPYIVIGKKTFNGYAESMNDELKSAIDDLYDSDERFDVFDKIDLSKETSESEEKSDSTLTIVFIIFAAIAIVALIVTSINKKKQVA